MCIKCVEDIVASLGYAYRKKIDELFEDSYTRLISGELAKPGIDKNAAAYFHKQMMDSSFRAIDGDFESFDQNSKRFEALGKLEVDALAFSIAKSKEYVDEATLLIQAGELSKAGLKQVLKHTFNRYYLQYGPTEINHVTNVAYAKDRWAEVQENMAMGETVILVYNSMRDERVREKHRALDDFKAPASHPIWNSIYPPNGYNCRCYVTMDFEMEGGESPIPDLKSLEIPDEFQKNFGRQNVGAFAGIGHPYLKRGRHDVSEINTLTPAVTRIKSDLLKGWAQINDNLSIHASEFINPSEGTTKTISSAKLYQTAFPNHKIQLLPDVKYAGLKNPDSIINKNTITEFKMQDGGRLEKFFSNRKKQAVEQHADLIVFQSKTDGDKDFFINKLNALSVKSIWQHMVTGEIIHVTK